MNAKKKAIDPVPDEFSSYEEAAEFWDAHDVTDYLDILKPVDMEECELRHRHYEVEVDADLIPDIRNRAKKRGLPVSAVVSDMLREQLKAVI